MQPLLVQEIKHCQDPRSCPYATFKSQLPQQQTSVLTFISFFKIVLPPMYTSLGGII